MEQLKLVAQALGLPLDSPIEKVVEAIGVLDKEAKDGRVWKVRAEENLTKLEVGQKTLQENAELKADAFIEKAKASYKITAAQAVSLKKMYLSGPEGKKNVEAFIEASADNEYLTRVASLTNVKESVSAIAEIEGRAAELIAKDPKLAKGDAMFRALTSDPELAARYRDEVVKGANEGGR